MPNGVANLALGICQSPDATRVAPLMDVMTGRAGDRREAGHVQVCLVGQSIGDRVQFNGRCTMRVKAMVVADMATEAFFTRVPMLCLETGKAHSK